MAKDEGRISEAHFTLPDADAADWQQAMRMPVLFEFFEKRTVAELLMDMHWLIQYVIFRQHQETPPR